MTAPGQYFWFIAALVGPALAIVTYLECRQVSARRPDLVSTCRRLVLAVGLLFSLPPLTIGVIQVLGGIPNPLYISSREFSNPFVLAGVVVSVAFYPVAILGIWLGQVANVVAEWRFVPLGPRRVRWILTGLFAVGLVLRLEGIVANSRI